MTFLEQVDGQLQRLAPLPGAVVAVSGGADSVALLRSLCQLRKPNELAAAHLNHRLRGPESEADEDFVRQLCQTLGVPFHSRSIDVAAEAQAAGANLEATARNERYRWFAEVARQLGMPYVATGHTADDQAETVLLRLIRGAGLQGLRGIAERRTLDEGVTLIRPMLAASRAAVRDYLHELQQPFREDRSNVDVRFARNRIRHVVLPMLAQESPAISDHLVQLAKQATAAFAVIEADAERLLAAAELPRAGSLCILRREALAGAARYLVCETLRLLWRRESWPTNDLRQVDWERAADVACAAAPAIDLPGRIHVRSVGRVAQVGPSGA